LSRRGTFATPAPIPKANPVPATWSTATTTQRPQAFW